MPGCFAAYAGQACRLVARHNGCWCLRELHDFVMLLAASIASRPTLAPCIVNDDANLGWRSAAGREALALPNKRERTEMDKRSVLWDIDALFPTEASATFQRRSP